MNKRIKRGFLICLVFCNICSVRSVAENPEIQTQEPGQLYAQSAVLMDADTGRVLFEKNGNEVRPMASTTKIMTCILALELGNLDSEVTVSEQASAQPKVKLGMRTGESFALRDLLYSMMLESHNDSAAAVAEYISGSVDVFVQLMNRKAESIGLKATHFVTPNGLDGTDQGGEHATTAEELALLLKYCICDSPQKEMFLEITRTDAYSFSDLKGEYTYSCRNHNAFLKQMEGALSGKTGFTGKAGYCYVGALKRGDRTLIVALLACGWPNNRNYKWKDVQKLMDYGLAHYQKQDVWKSFQPVRVQVRNGTDGENGIWDDAYTTVQAKTEEQEWKLLLKDTEQVKVTVDLEEMLYAPVMKGKKVGVIRYELDGKVLKTVPLVADRTVYRRDFKWCFMRLAEKIMLDNIK